MTCIDCSECQQRITHDALLKEAMHEFGAELSDLIQKNDEDFCCDPIQPKENRKVFFEHMIERLRSEADQIDSERSVWG